MAGNDLADLLNSIPVMTRYWFCGTIGLSLIGRIGLANPMYLILLWEKLAYSLQIWRPLTALLYYPINPNTGFHFLINLYFLYSYSSRLESGMFYGKTADFAFLLGFNWICLTIIGILSEFYVLMEPMVLSVMYIWCQLSKDTIVQFWFGTKFKAMYLPWILLAFNLIIRGSAMMEIVGIVVGHLYFFFMFQYPREYGGRQLLSTPSFLYKFFPMERGSVNGFGVPPAFARNAQSTSAASGRSFSGRGHVLGQSD